MSNNKFPLTPGNNGFGHGTTESVINPNQRGHEISSIHKAPPTKPAPTNSTSTKKQ